MALEKGSFLLDGKPFFIYSGEVHYFRMPKNTWKDRLKKLKQAGFNSVSFYIPWVWHEVEEGKFDFTGDTLPERDVLGFIKMAEDEGILIQVRVGPVANAELRGEGIPHWLLKKHPEVIVKENRDKETDPGAAVLSYLHPTLQKRIDTSTSGTRRCCPSCRTSRSPRAARSSPCSSATRSP
jgi:beta-galactosidase